MTEAVLEWVEKAESDFESAELVNRPPKGKPNYDLVCFLSQQCVEKYLKGFLMHHDIAFTKTPNLAVLLDLTLLHQPLWESWRNAFERIGEYAVEFRYPGEKADTKNAKTALEIASTFRKEALTALGLSNILP